MNDVRDEALGALLEQAAVGSESAPVDRLPDVLGRGSRRRAGRFTAIGVAVALFVGAVSWAGLSMREVNGTIPADVADWRTFGSLENNGWTIQVPPTWHVVELPACRGAPKRIGVIVTNVDFEFRDPRGGPPDCGDRLVFAGFPRDGVALGVMPIVGDSIPGLLFQLPDTIFPLTPDLLVQTDGIRGGPSESFQSIWLFKDWIGVVRRFVGPEAAATDIAALDGMLGSFQVAGAPRWVAGHVRSLGDIRVSFTRPESWRAAGYPNLIVIDAPTPILRLRSPGIRGDGCELPGTPWIRVGAFDDFGVEIVVSDGSESFVAPDLPPRPNPIRSGDALRRRSVTCKGQRLRVFSFGFEEAGKPIYIDVVATQSVYREQPEMLLYLLNSILIEVI
jgi:hypothetical protein